MRIALASITALALAAPAFATPVEDFRALIADYEAFTAERNLSARARQGDLDAAASWPDVSVEAIEGWDAGMAGFDARIDAIDPADLPADEQANYAVLAYTLDSAVAVPSMTTSMVPFTNDSGFHTTASFAALTTRVRSVEEAEAWIEKLHALPDYFAQQQAWLERGVETGFTQPRAILQGVADQIEAQITPAEDSEFLTPIRNLPETIPAAERERLMTEAVEAVETSALPALRELHAFFTDVYMPAARDTLGARDLPGGEDFYRALVRQHTTLDMTPEQVHQRGQAEVARIRADMEAIIEETGFEGSFDDFLDFLRTDPQFYAESERELMMAASYFAKQADDQMPRFFHHLPRLSYGVRPVPAAIAPNYTTARYWPGDAEQGIAGGYMVNTYRLDQRPLYELPALTVHEAVPGHHHQIAIAQELENVPEFRTQGYITAFGEGWALYTEFLGQDMGIYETPYQHFGRLTYEMWRACRLVADTGIHWYGWSREEAEACFLENSALSPLNITNEVSRYISWPGQALAYKTGELLIRELRADAEAELGENFDLAAFHDHILDEGAVPLGYLETKMRAWIDEQAAE
ncbi:DUF885 family protein [Oceanicaulis sp. MMSF_3324]|uniref:DUF885 domain-containing protein n=1 Tax=Oceanicaulis sp. MMSF_3324 TaxID=3046702 RepID=UPI00273EF597|nr:DUF885 domain-containing protein [Oceanicaulis sp. MMSF_3324]